MSKWLKATNEAILEIPVSNNFAITQARKALDFDCVDDNLIEELENIESEMSNGNCINFRDVEELVERYGL